MIPRLRSATVWGCMAVISIIVTGCASTTPMGEPEVEIPSPPPVADPALTGPPPGYVKPEIYWVRERIVLTSEQEPPASATQKSAVKKGKKSKKTGKRVTG
jgi:hypothetical protein